MHKIDKVQQELRKLAAENSGVLLPEQVVASARNPKSVLHSRFEWDDTKAAESYRIWQARQLIRVVVEQIQGVSGPTEVFVSLTTDRRGTGGYRVVTEVLSRAESRAQMLEDAFTELEIFKLKYQRLRELAVVFDAAKKAKKRFSGKG